MKCDAILIIVVEYICLKWNGIFSSSAVKDMTFVRI